MAIAVYGATGYTGRLVVAELAARGAELVLGGRDRTRLVRVAEEQGAGARHVAARVDEPKSLRRLMGGCRVVVNCAGPFTLAGEEVVRAAVDSGCHYVDSTGEQPYIRAVLERHGPDAERRGVALVPALGFDYAPGDCIARLAAEGLEPLEQVELGYSVEGFGASRGTARSALEIMKGGDVVYVEGAWRSPPRFERPRTFDFPQPLGRRPVARFPAGEVLTVPRHSRARNVRAWVSADQLVPFGVLARAVPLAMPGIELALKTPLRRAAGALVARLPEGPPEDRRRASRFTVVADATGADGSRRRGVVRGGDVYGLTAAILARCATAMDSDGYDRRGGLGPAAAFDPAELLDDLADRGLTYELHGAPVGAAGSG